MCATSNELNAMLAELQGLKKIKEEAEDNIKAIEREVVEFLEENEEEYKTTSNKGKEIIKFIGNLFTATLTEQTGESVDKEEVKKILDEEEYQKVSRVSRFKVLRVK